MKWCDQDNKTIRPPVMENISCVFTIEGKPFVVCMSQEDLRMTFSFGSAVTHNGMLPVRQLSDDYEMVDFTESDLS